MEEITTGHEVASPEDLPCTSPQVDLIAIEQPAKSRGRQRLIQSLQRISSSPSLARMGRTSTYNGTGGASLSCVSLTSPTSSYGHSYGSSYSSQSSTQSTAGFSTAPTSGAVTPSGEMPFFDFKHRIRALNNRENVVAPVKGPQSVPLPTGMQMSSLGAALASAPDVQELPGDYFSIPRIKPKPAPRRPNFSLWGAMPDEIRVRVLHFLKPKEIVRCSAVSKQFHAMCFDGQLWASLDASEFYKEIPGETLVKIMTSAGPFMQDLNLRGCAQMYERWTEDTQQITDVCRNLKHFSIEGCKIDRTSVHYFLLRNPSLVHVNVSGCSSLNNSAMKIIAQTCPSLEYLNVSWCQHIDGKGLQKVVRACPKLKDLRASEVKGFNDEEFLLELFERNSLERLLISHCADFDSNALTTLLQGKDPEFDVLTGRAMVPPRTFRHLDFHRCRNLADAGVKLLAHNTPNLVGLRLSQCSTLTDEAVEEIFQTCPDLTHLDLEELDLTNAALVALSKGRCASNLSHLNISYCENLGDGGMLPVLKTCTSITSLEMDNTRVSDLVLAEIAGQVRHRNRMAQVGNPSGKPELGLHVVAYDCSNVTWTGIREVLSRNGEFIRRPLGSTAPQYPKEVISLKCFYGYQPTVREHTKRVLKGELARATLLERKWAEYMIATEEAGAEGSGIRRRRRRAREAERVHADEQDEYLGRGGRRRARSGGCTIM